MRRAWSRRAHSSSSAPQSTRASTTTQSAPTWCSTCHASTPLATSPRARSASSSRAYQSPLARAGAQRVRAGPPTRRRMPGMRAWSRAQPAETQRHCRQRPHRCHPRLGRRQAMNRSRSDNLARHLRQPIKKLTQFNPLCHICGSGVNEPARCRSASSVSPSLTDREHEQTTRPRGMQTGGSRWGL